MRSRTQRFVEIFGDAAATHGAAGWQMNAAASARSKLGHRLRVRHPRQGALRAGGRRRSARPAQLPTTLPTLDELIGVDGMNAHNVADALLALTDGDGDQVYTLHAELEGALLAPVLQRLLLGWRAQGHALVPPERDFEHVRVRPLPKLPMTWSAVPGRSGELSLGDLGCLNVSRRYSSMGQAASVLPTCTHD